MVNTVINYKAMGGSFARRPAQQWLIAATHLVQTGSNSTGDERNWGNSDNILDLSSATFSLGKGGLSLQSMTVHFLSNSFPK